MISRDLFDRIDAFREMNEKQIEAARVCCQEMNFKSGNRLFAEGDAATHLWFVVNGNIDLRFEMPGRETSGEHTVSTIEADGREASAQAIGWSCLVAPFRMRLSAYCTSPDCKVLRIKKEDLLGLFREDPQMGYLFMSHMVTVVGHRFHSFQEYIATHLGHGIMHGW